MTPSERERRIEAAMVPLDRAFPREWQRRYVANAVLAAADEAVPMVPVCELEAMRQAGRIWLDRGKEMEQWAERAEATARDLATALQAIVASGCIEEAVIARDALARHPSFSGGCPPDVQAADGP